MKMVGSTKWNVQVSKTRRSTRGDSDRVGVFVTDIDYKNALAAVRALAIKGTDLRRALFHVRLSEKLRIVLNLGFLFTPKMMMFRG